MPTAPSTVATIAPPPRHDDPWHVYHLLVAIIVVAGFFEGVRGDTDIWKALHGLNGLQESGLAASVALLATSLRGIAAQLVLAIMRLLRR